MAKWGKIVFLFIGLFMVSAFAIVARDDPEFESGRHPIIVNFQFERWLKKDLSAFKWDNNIYIPLVKLFRQLSVKIEYDPRRERVEGFFITPEQSYVISLARNVASRKSRRIQFNRNDYIKKERDLFVNIHLLNDLFDLGLDFNPQTMSVQMQNTHEFPYLKRMKRRRVLNNRLKESRKRDSLRHYAASLPVHNAFFNPGSMNWNVQVSHLSSDRLYSADMTHSGVLAGGDYQVYSGWSTASQNFSFLDGRWRWVNLSGMVRQVQVGTSIDRPYQPIHSPGYEGLYVTNKLPVRSGPFTTYKMPAKTPINRDVAIFRNRRIINYLSNGTEGKRNYSVPLGYGSHMIQMDVHGPHGELHRQRSYFQIPGAMIPPGEWRYELAGGRMRRRLPGGRGYPWGGFATGGYGLTEDVTIRAGVNASLGSVSPDGYLNVLWNRKKAHYINGYISRSGTHGVSLRYRRPGELNYRMEYALESLYSRELPGMGMPNRRRILAEIQQTWQWNSFRANVLLSNRISQFNGRNQGVLNWMNRLQWKNFHVGLEPRWRYRFNSGGTHSVDFQSRVTAGVTLFKNYQTRLEARWSHKRNRLYRIKGNVHKRLNRSWQVSMGGTWDKRAGGMFTTSVRLDLSFIRGHSRFSAANRQLHLRQQLGGTLRLTPGSHNIRASSRPWNEQGKIVMKPYLDLNADGLKDEKDPWLDKKEVGLKVNPHTSYAMGVQQPSLYRSYTPGMVKVQSSPFSSYQVPDRYKVVKVYPFPYVTNIVPTPVQAQKSISGQVHVSPDIDEKQATDSWQVVVKYLNSSSSDTLQTLPSGRFFHALKTGEYKIELTSEQLERHEVVSCPSHYRIRVRAKSDRRRLNDLKFSIKSVNDGTRRDQPPSQLSK